jgi:hypothetical protein
MIPFTKMSIARYALAEIRQMAALLRLRLLASQAFDKTEMSLRPWPVDTLRAGRLAIARRSNVAPNGECGNFESLFIRIHPTSCGNKYRDS